MIADELSEEISEDSKAQNSETDVVRDDRSETNDDGITYEIAAKLCDELMKHDRDVMNISENPCSCDDNFKWTKLYQKLVNCQQI